MDNNNKTIYLAVQRKGDLEYIKEVIKKYHQGYVVETIKAPDIFQSLTGLVNLVEKFESKGLVYVKPEEFMPEGIRIVTKRGLRYGILLKNSKTGERTPFVVNQVRAARIVRRRFRRRMLVQAW